MWVKNDSDQVYILGGVVFAPGDQKEVDDKCKADIKDHAHLKVTQAPKVQQEQKQEQKAQQGK